MEDPEQLSGIEVVLYVLMLISTVVFFVGIFQV